MKKRLLALLMLLTVLLTPVLSGCSQDEFDTAAGVLFAVLEDTSGSADETSELSQDEKVLDPNGSYTDEEDVAAYLNIYGELPENFITKNEAKALGWDSSKGNLQEVAPGKSIGGDRFGNYEEKLPEGNWKECDVNYHGGFRGGERLVFSDKGDIYYTNDHYETFEQMY